MTNRTKSILRKGLVFALALAWQSGASGCNAVKESEPPVTLAIAWTNTPESYSYTSTIVAAEETGANVVLLDQVKSYDLSYDSQEQLTGQKDAHGILSSSAAKRVKTNTWLNSNAEEVLQGVDCVIVPGGWDISPTLYYQEETWHGIEEDGDYSAERDVSDYLLLSYCLDHDIPVFCICRGMQMLGVVSGAEMIQDIGTYFEEKGIAYSDLHRDPERKQFTAHAATITETDSLLHQIMGTEVVEGCPSWHHQALKRVDDTRLVVTAVTETDGEAMIEAIERPDRSFCLGVQYHPEVSVRKIIEQESDRDTLMDYETAMKPFRALVEYCRKA